MAIIKCKMCGGDLNLIEGQTVAECEYCGSQQTVPTADNEKKLTLFSRANRLRSACEFDKAAGIYETIVAEFPEEAEAYWGLILCKYGIEYVDDPATGRKIPTCHRSSFDSIMDDGDLEQALENADSVARRVYRAEAKQIEEIRKGIIAVSANEEPYDIFICYKETAENGERTLDSVLAQDVYDALVDKGYRTFFARISLEDKLGVEYEPYIFAALNSAKIMLAFGTDYDYFNAVWVKNEWSRFLKLMSKDKSKHLIPCYKGIDAYDMPKEFAKLQAQDLGKVGAIQDLLRGIEKLLPKKDTLKVIQEKVVVGGGSLNKIASLLDRGNMALEDGDWAKADSFFEDVLNNDSKNAQAYLGKTLVQEKCRTIDAFIRKRKDFVPDVKPQRLSLEPDHSAVNASVDKYAVPGYLTEESIRAMYVYDLSYSSEVQLQRQRYNTEKDYWAKHKHLSRAEKFAVGAVAENLAAEKKALFAVLGARVKKTEEAETAAKDALRQSYTRFLRMTDEKVAQLYQEAIQRRENHYQALVAAMQRMPGISELPALEKKFISLGDYKDSAAQAEYCRQQIAEKMAKIEEARKLRQKQEIERAEREKRRKIAILSALGIAAVVLIAVILVVVNVVIPANKYDSARKMLDSGNYRGAIEILSQIPDQKDSSDLLRQASLKVLPNVKKGDVVYLGSYQGEVIPWTVISVGNGKALLIANRSIADMPLHESGGSVSPDAESYHYNEWPNCSLRAWLNGEFLNEAFSGEEKAVLTEATVESAGEHKQEGPVYDKVYIPSQAEVSLISVQTDWGRDGLARTEFWLRGSSGTNGMYGNVNNSSTDYGLDRITRKCAIVPIICVDIDSVQ